MPAPFPASGRMLRYDHCASRLRSLIYCTGLIESELHKSKYLLDGVIVGSSCDDCTETDHHAFAIQHLPGRESLVSGAAR